MKDKKKTIKSEVVIIPSGKGFFIRVKDKYTDNKIAITRDELERIILYGTLMLENSAICTICGEKKKITL